MRIRITDVRRVDAAANRIAHHLAEQGVGPGDHVGLHARNSLEFVESLLGASRSAPSRSTSTSATSTRNSPTSTTTRSWPPSSPTASSATSSPTSCPSVPSCGTSCSSASRPDRHWRTPLPPPTSRSSTITRLPPRSPQTATSRSAAPTISTSSTRAATTGMPKGVMWRHEDFYHAALAGGAIMGGDPILSPAELGAAAAANQFAMTYWDCAADARCGVLLALHLHVHGLQAGPHVQVRPGRGARAGRSTQDQHRHGRRRCDRPSARRRDRAARRPIRSELAVDHRFGWRAVVGECPREAQRAAPQRLPPGRVRLVGVRQRRRAEEGRGRPAAHAAVAEGSRRRHRLLDDRARFRQRRLPRPRRTRAARLLR